MITLICLITITGVRIFEHLKTKDWAKNELIWKKNYQAISALEALAHTTQFSKYGNRYYHQLKETQELNLTDLQLALSSPSTINPVRRQEIISQVKREIDLFHHSKLNEKNDFSKIFNFFNFYVLAVIVGSCLILVWRLIKGFSQDLNLITKGYRDAGEGNLFTQVPPPHFKEWNPVVIGFNLMQKDLQKVHNKLRQKDRIESLGHMSAGIAHEMGNPLAAILGYTELLEEKLDKEGQSDLHKIINKVSQCRKIVDDLLLFCRGEEAGTVLNTVSLKQIFDSISEDCCRDFPSTLTIHDDLESLDIKTHGTSVKQILYNLVANAYLAGATKVNIRRGSSPDKDLRLLIEDNGPGIAKDIASKIFEPFFTTRPAGQGTGLGLSICHGLAKQNGGYLSLTSLQHPTRFELVLPCLS